MLAGLQLKPEEGQVLEKKPRKKRTPKEVMMADDDGDSDEDCAALKCLKPTGTVFVYLFLVPHIFTI